jgi:hypothetical protein
MRRKPSTSTSKAGGSAAISSSRHVHGAAAADRRAQGDIDKLNQTIREGSRGAYRDAGESARGFQRETSEGFDEIKESARSNAIEVGASFTGGFDQAAGGLQGFVAEFLAGFGPGGVIAGVGAAALIG